MSDTKALRERLAAHYAHHFTLTLKTIFTGEHHDFTRHPLVGKAIAALVRLEAERDAARREAIGECIALLETEHDRRKHLDNHALVYANMLRERLAKP